MVVKLEGYHPGIPVYKGLPVNSRHSFEVSNKIRVLRSQMSGMVRLYLPFGNLLLLGFFQFKDLCFRENCPILNNFCPQSLHYFLEGFQIVAKPKESNSSVRYKKPFYLEFIGRPHLSKGGKSVAISTTRASMEGSIQLVFYVGSTEADLSSASSPPSSKSSL